MTNFRPPLNEFKHRPHLATAVQNPAAARPETLLSGSHSQSSASFLLVGGSSLDGDLGGGVVGCEGMGCGWC